jgi:hypothetical protein
MKLSTINWLSGAIVLPLFIATSNILPASAGASRSTRISFENSKTRTIRAVPSATDLNLRIPVTAAPIVSEGSEPGNAIEPFWANPDRPTSTIVPKQPIIKTKSTSTKKDLSTPNLRSAKLPENSRKDRSSISLKQKNLGSRNTETLEPIVKNNRQIAAVSGAPLDGNYLRLVSNASKGKNSIGNPIYTLETYINGRKDREFNVVSGTATTQNADRNRGNNFAPLPDGLYDVSDRIIPGKTPEVGKTFISIFPKFETNRNELGIHLDRSFDRSNGYDGTAGCIGMTTPTDRDAINEFVTKYRPRNLFVNITSASN